MKKLIIAFVGFMLFSPSLFAQWDIGPFPGLEALFYPLYQEQKERVEMITEIEAVNISSQTIHGNYYTEQQMAPEDLELPEADRPKSEKHVTDTYTEVSVIVPEGYSINKYMTFDYDSDQVRFPFLPSSSVLMYTTFFNSATGKYEEFRDISFKLDYDVTLENSEDAMYMEDGYWNNALTLKIRYANKYFDFEKVYENYTPLTTEEITYNGKKITLNAHVHYVLVITTPSGYHIRYILKPNLQSIYSDFKFVRRAFNRSK